MTETVLTVLYAPLGIAVGVMMKGLGRPNLIPLVNAVFGGLVGFGLNAGAGMMPPDVLAAVRWPWLISVLVGVASGLGATGLRKAVLSMGAAQAQGGRP